MTNEEKSHVNDVKIAILENNSAHLHETLQEIKQTLRDMNKKFDEKFDKINNRLWELLFFTIGGFLGVLGLIAHAFHWI